MRCEYVKYLALIALWSLSGGCSLLGRDAVSEPSTEVKAEADSKLAAERTAKLKDEQELKLARLWARVDELEEEQSRSKERLAIVEKGVILGLMPEELRRPEAGKKGRQRPSQKPTEATKSGGDELDKTTSAALPAGDLGSAVPNSHAQTDVAKAAAAKGAGGKAGSSSDDRALKTPSGLSPEDADAYQKALASAHDLFRAGRYGRAVVEYSEIGKRFGDEVGGGMHLYWMAKSWASLKEYNTARQHLLEFLKDHPKSPWVPRATFELGRVEWQLGMQETALGRFREIIQRHPYEDAAEMAKMELQNLDKKL